MNTVHPPPAPDTRLHDTSGVAAPLAAGDQPLMCPSCHTVLATSTDVAYQSGSNWQCQRCGEHWTASRLATVAEYQAWDRRRSDTDAAAPSKAPAVG